ncbi:two-component regulator propeller domain-containing protein [Flavobacterium pectinovorum]|uniref:AraC family transcriptional regulator n=1 Tax=Flavobacterium pectinovorum TaxID=29533 RepID=A0AB36NW69_9FLAO|nr:two-component regulator propeller domain-containing protein [Flavobacterium pectinovorum]OXB00868.1 AraC family transcriptional regulator [Flavobacterium pectinovorum]SHN19097.1 AraC-type DNA-binding protein [Flavobacterium pectinovorum]
MIRVLLVFCLSTIYSFGQQIKFENFTTNQGLSNNSVLDIESDKDGGLWIATWDGLNYFDGYSFKIFKNNFKDHKTVSSNYITKLQKDALGRIWLITKEGNVNQYLGNDEFAAFKFKSTPKGIHLSQKGNIVVETSTAYYEFKNNSFVEIPQNNVQRTDFENLKSILLRKYPKLIINDILKDKLGNIWFATRENGLYIITNESNENNIEHFTSDLYAPYSFTNNEIETLHEDDFGNIWLGQKDGGLSMAFTGSEKINSVMPHPIKEPNLPDETIRAVTKDSKGKIWLGYYTRGLYCYNDRSHLYEKFKIDKAASSPDWERIRTLFTSSDGTVWAGTYKGILRISDTKCTSYETSNIKGMPVNRCYSMFEDQNKQLWMGCWGGLAKFNLTTGKFETFKGQELLNKYNIRCVKKNNQNLILATENNGVIVFNLTTSALKKITTKDGILGNSVYSVFVDNESDNYWIASLGGITVFNKKTGVIKNITESEGLPSHMVYGLIDNGNKIWVSTTKGLASIDKKKYTVTSYNPDHGWQAPEFSEGAYHQDSKGNLFFGGINGLNYFNPGTIHTENSKARVKLKIDGNENYPAEIEKSFSDNELEIEIIPILFPKAKRSDIYYKLEGNDEEWIPLGANNKIEYTDLSSGDYVFMIKQGKNGIPEPAFFTLHITEAFYESALFYILLSGFILLVCVIVIYVKNKRALVEQKYLEELVKARTNVIEKQKKNLEEINAELDKKNKKIEEQKEKLLILHSNFKNENFEIEKFKTFMLAEFQDPIARIIEISSSFKKDTETQRALMSQSGKLMNLISEWNYLEHVKELGPIKKTATDLFPVLKNNVEKLKKELQLHQVNFNCEIDKTDCFAIIDVLRLKLALQYFFNDFCKYSDRDSTLSIAITYENNFLKINAVSDSVILKNNWQNIVHYSPYFRALQVLIQDLEGELIPSSEEQFQTTILIPIEVVDPETNFKETISWKNFNYEDQFSSDKKCLLVFGDPFNNAAANQVLESENYNLIFESSVSNLNAITKQIDIAALVFYQVAFSNDLIHFLKTNKGNTNIKIPMIYISEDINYELDEQLLEIGIDTHIKLPARASFIRKKIDSLINQNAEPLREYKIQQKIFEILTEDNEHITPNEKLLKRALEIIKEELQNPSFNVEMLVEQLGISRVKCYRLFKETLNQSPLDILMSLRLQKAEVLLKTKRLNISEISFECGYNDPKYFGRSFKKYFGKSPKEYKEYST